jgi:hypothetical protein
MKKLTFLLGLALLAIGFGPSLLAEEDYGQPAATVIVPAGLTEQEIQRGILEAGAGRGWTIRKKEDGKVVLFLEKRGWTSNLTFTYTKEEVQVFSKSVRKGKSELPKAWIENLKEDLTKILNSKAILK